MKTTLKTTCLLVALTLTFMGLNPKESISNVKGSISNRDMISQFDNAVAYESSISCNLISTIELRRESKGTIVFKRSIRQESNKNIPSRLIVQGDIPYTSNSSGQATIDIPNDGSKYWFISFEPNREPIECAPTSKIVVYDCFCKEAPADYVGSAYCALKAIFGGTNNWFCVHQACCECKLITTEIKPTVGGAGVLLRANYIKEY